MARATVTIPPALKAFPRDVHLAVRNGLNQGGQEGVTLVRDRIRKTGAVDRARMWSSIGWFPGPRATRGWAGHIGSGGTAAKYADVQDKGRRAGARRPPMNAIRSWVRRQMKPQVDALARKLQAQYAAAHPGRYRRGGKLVSRSIAKFRKRAIHLIARGVIRKMTAKGMPGKGFARDSGQKIAALVAAAIDAEVGELIRRKGLNL